MENEYSTEMITEVRPAGSIRCRKCGRPVIKLRDGAPGKIYACAVHGPLYECEALESFILPTETEKEELNSAFGMRFRD